MHRKAQTWSVVALIAMGAAGTAYAVDQEVGGTSNHGSHQHGGAATGTKGPDVTPTDDVAKTQMVLRFLHSANQDELRAGRLAVEKAQAPDVKQLAEHMVKDHADNDKRLMEIAKKGNIDLVQTMPADPVHTALANAEQASERDLATKAGAAFDVAYLIPMVKDHQVLLMAVEQGQKIAPEGDIKALLNDTHKVVSAHLEEARRFQDRLHLQAGGPVGGGPARPPAEEGQGVRKPEPRPHGGAQHD